MHRQALTINFYISISVCYYKIVVGNKFVFFFTETFFVGKTTFFPETRCRLVLIVHRSHCELL